MQSGVIRLTFAVPHQWYAHSHLIFRGDIVSENASCSAARPFPADSPLHCLCNSWFDSFPACALCSSLCPWDRGTAEEGDLPSRSAEKKTATASRSV